MGLRTRCAFLAIPALSMAFAAGGNKPSDTPAEPRYDAATVVDVEVIVVQTREVAKDNPLAGMHLVARLESARADAEPLDVYLGPAEFIKMFDFAFHAGDRLEVIGSKVKLGATSVILGRELHRSDTTLYIRDQRGDPVWKYMLKGPS